MGMMSNQSGEFITDRDGVLITFKPAVKKISFSKPLRKKIKTLVIPKGVISIAQELFQGYEIGCLKLPRSLKAIPKEAFANTVIGEIDFSKFQNGKEIFEKNRVQNHLFSDELFLHRTAFLNSTIKKVVIPDGFFYHKQLYECMLYSIGEAFQSIYNFHEKLTMIENESGIFWFDALGILHDYQLFYSDEESNSNPHTIRNLIIPEGVTVIQEECFRGITVCETLHLPSSLKVLGSGHGCAFSDCVLPDVIIADSLQLGHYSFGSSVIRSLCIKNGFCASLRQLKDAKIKKLYLRTNQGEKPEIHIDSKYIEEMEWFCKD
ncbi:MAG: hypothetical protein E7399_02840 [Ruminococcaceae bacterium]|nr:hypothetical protein [Oscillospiraceae bacterium]